MNTKFGRTKSIDFGPYELEVSLYTELGETERDSFRVVLKLDHTYTETVWEDEYGVILVRTVEKEVEKSTCLAEGRGEAETVGGAFSRAEGDLIRTMKEEMDVDERKERIEERMDACMESISTTRIQQVADELVDDN